MSDAVGVLVSWTGGVLRVRRKDGTVAAIAEESLVAGKVVPQRGAAQRTHAATGVRDLEEVAALGWRGTETEWLGGHGGGWLLRAAGGWTGRANSVLPLGDPGVPADEAIVTVRGWYAARGLTPRFQIPLPPADGLDAVLAGLGWTAPDEVGGVLVMTADVDDVLTGAPERALPPVPLPPVLLNPTPGPGWLATYRYRGGPLPEGALAVLLHADAPVFAEVVEGGATLAVGRASVDGAWVGITAMDTARAARRRGLGGAVLRALVEHGRQAGARHVYLQVSAANLPAIGLYASLGLSVHHRYHYRVAPAGEAQPGETQPGEAT